MPIIGIGETVGITYLALGAEAVKTFPPHFSGSPKNKYNIFNIVSVK